MQIFTTAKHLEWGRLDVPILGLDKDWSGNKLDPPFGFALLKDPTRLWFVATRGGSSVSHPDSTPRNFMPGLWKYDVSELFLANPITGEYLEFNIAPNGAWWASKFTGVRTQSTSQPDFREKSTVYSEEASSTHWTVALSLPLDFLREIIGFNAETTTNVTAILNSPDQTFHSATKLPGELPDFHQPSAFQTLREIEIA